jgi:hypothetical protein
VGLPVLNYNQGSTFRINSSNNRLYYRLNSPRVDNFVTLNSGDLSAEGVANAHADRSASGARTWSKQRQRTR